MPSHIASKSAAEPRMIFFFRKGKPLAERPERLLQDGDLGLGPASPAHGNGKGVGRAHHHAFEHRLTAYG